MGQIQTSLAIGVIVLLAFSIINFLRFVPEGTWTERDDRLSRKELPQRKELSQISKEFSKQKPGIKTADLEKEVERLTGVSIQDLIKKRQDKELQVQVDQDNQDSKESALQHSNTDFQADTRQNKDGNSVPWADAVRCRDVLEQCKFWAQSGQCVLNAAFMLHSCSDSCAVCLHTSPMVANAHYSVQLASQKLMPTVGFGTAGLGDETYQAILDALSVGYKLIDSAEAREWYREDLVGKAIKDSGVNRDNLFITSKLHPRDLHRAVEAVEQSLVDLKTDHLDLFLIHYPRCWIGLCGEIGDSLSTWQDAWLSLEKLVEAGKIRALGVSNFDLAELSELVKLAHVKPSVVQVRSDPFSSNRLIQAFCKAAGIQFQAYSSLGTQWTMSGQGQDIVMENKVIIDLASKVGCSPVQVVLRWALQHGQAVVPRSRSKLHMTENLKVVRECVLTDADMKAIDGLESAVNS